MTRGSPCSSGLIRAPIVTLHARLVELFSRYNSLFPERADPQDLVEQLAIIRERSLHPDELSASALRVLAERGCPKRSTTR